MTIFTPTERARALHEKLQSFMNENVYPSEAAFYRERAQGDRWQPSAVVESLKEKARAAGLWNLFLPESAHGAGLTNLEYAPLCEVMGRVLFAPYARLSSIVHWSTTSSTHARKGGGTACVPGSARARRSSGRAPRPKRPLPRLARMYTSRPDQPSVPP